MEFRKAIHAVLSADIIKATRLSVEREQILLKALEVELSAYIVTFYQGEGFQVYIMEPENALWMALVCRTLAINITEEERIPTDVRISIGLGRVEVPVKMPGNARGEAFILSGRGLYEIQNKEQRLYIRSDHKMADIGFEVIADYLDSIFSKMTVKQARVLLGLLRGLTQHEMALLQGKSKSTISELASAGGWPEIEKLLQRYRKLINLLRG